MKTDDHREKFKQFSENDLVVVRGVIPDIDEYIWTKPLIVSL